MEKRHPWHNVFDSLAQGFVAIYSYVNGCSNIFFITYLAIIHKRLCIKIAAPDSRLSLKFLLEVAWASKAEQLSSGPKDKTAPKNLKVKKKPYRLK